MFVGAWAVYNSLLDDRNAGQVVQSVELLGPATPPKPEPEPPPEEMEIEESEVELEAPVEQTEPAGAIDDRLGVDGDATGAGDGFGLVAKRGGREIIGLEGTGDGAAMSLAVGQFAQAVRADIERQLADRAELRKSSYVATVKLWIEPDGRVLRFELSQISAGGELRSVLESALGTLRRVTAPPVGMPLPIWLRISATVRN
jgi:hypothetical protein